MIGIALEGRKAGGSSIWRARASSTNSLCSLSMVAAGVCGGAGIVNDPDCQTWHSSNVGPEESVCDSWIVDVLWVVGNPNHSETDIDLRSTVGQRSAGIVSSRLMNEVGVHHLLPG